MTFSAMTIVTVTVSLMGGLLLGLGRLRQNLVAEVDRHREALTRIDELA